MRPWLVLGMLGVLISQYAGPSVTGKLVWSCTYRVGPTTATVVLDHMCPVTMQFD